MHTPDPPSGPVRGHLRSRAYTRVSHGLYKPASEVDGLRQDLAAWRLVLPPSARFTHLTAAQVYGWWLPPLPSDLPVFVSMAKADNRPRRDGLRVSRHPPAPVGPDLDGLPLASPIETILASARDLGLLDVTVLIDAAVHLGFCELADLHRLSRERRYGAPRLRRALRFADPRAESAWETLLRVLHVVCDVPVESQYVLTDEDGGFVARGDLRILGTTTLHEYDGGEHRNKNRQRKDLARERRIGNAVWTRRGSPTPRCSARRPASCATRTAPWGGRTAPSESGPGTS